MLIRCWGARGGIPVSGCDVVKYGGDTCCLEIRTRDGKVIIVDAGTGVRRLGQRLLAEAQQDFTFIFTHAHWDHILGFPFFKPIYLPSTHIEMRGCPFARESIREMLAETMTPPYFPVPYDAIAASINYNGPCTEAFSVGSVEVTPILLSHPNQGIGYKFTEDGKSFVFLTDNELTYTHPGGLTYPDYLEFTRGADLLIHDAEFTQGEYDSWSRTWGHSVYTDALRLAMEAGVKRFGLFHHNADRTDDQVDALVEECRKTASAAGSSMTCFATATDWEITL